MKNGKTLKWLLTLACLLAALCAFTLAANAEIVDSGYCGAEGDGKNLTWTLDDAGTLTIKGTGEMENYDYSSGPWTVSVSNTKCVKTVEIQKGVTSIGNCAFNDCKELILVKIPDSVTIIGEGAFFDCKALTAVTIPDSVTNIGEYAFYDCKALTVVTIPDSVTNIREYAFYDCKALTTVTIPDSVTNIGEYAFYDCKALTTVTIPDSVTSVGDNAFENCTSLTEVTIPNSITDFGYGVFSNCTAIEKLTVGKPIECLTINELGIPKDKIKTVVIKDGVTKICDNAFYDCTYLKEITIPDGVTHIGFSAFSDCEDLENIMIPDSVTHIGSGAFKNTLWLYNQPNGLVLAGKVAIAYKGDLPKNKALILPKGTKGIGAVAFEYLYFESVEFPDSLEVIGDYAFDCCDGLNIIVLPQGIKEIGSGAFNYCDDISSVNVPLSLRFVGADAFDNCKIKDVYYEGSEEQWKGITIEKHNLPLSRYATIHYNYKPVFLGDVDGDSNITSADARLALRASVGLENYAVGSAQYLACDVDGDGKVTSADARLILRASVGLEDASKFGKKA